MSEEIIIDGVNVAECEFYEEIRELPDNLNGGYYIQHCYCGLQGDNYCICNKNNNCYYKQLKRLQKTLKHTENGKKVKAEKLKRIEEIVIHCIQGGFTDEFVQEIFDICREYEEV